MMGNYGKWGFALLSLGILFLFVFVPIGVVLIVWGLINLVIREIKKTK